MKGKKYMKKILKRAISLVLVSSLMVGVVPTTVWAAMGEGAQVKKEILSELETITGDADTAQKLYEHMGELGVFDKNSTWGNEKLKIDGKEYTLEEAAKLVGSLKPEDEIVVDGTAITAGDFQTMLDIEEEIKRLKETYFTNHSDEFTEEHYEALDSLQEQIASDGGLEVEGQTEEVNQVALYSASGASELTFPSGINHNAKITMAANKTAFHVANKETITVTFTLKGANAGQEVSFRAYTIDGSAVAGTHYNKVDQIIKLTADKNGTATQSVAISNIQVSGGLNWGNSNYDIWNGSRIFFLRITDMKNASVSGSSMLQFNVQSGTVTFPDMSQMKWEANNNSTEITSKSVDAAITESMVYLMKRGVINCYDFSSVISGNKQNTYYQSDNIYNEEKLNNGYYTVNAYYQYVKSGVFAGDTKQLGTYAGYTRYLDKKKDFNNTPGNFRNYMSDNHATREALIPKVSDVAGDTKIESITTKNQAIPDWLKVKQTLKIVSEGWCSHGTFKNVMEWSASLDITNTPIQAVTTFQLKDTNAPKVTGVTAPTEGGFRAGDKIPITVVFSEPVKCNNTAIKVGTSTSELKPIESSGTISSAITFLYEVKAGDEGIRSNGLQLTNVTTQDFAGNNLADTTGRTVAKPNPLDTYTLSETFDNNSISATAFKPAYTPKDGDIEAKTTAKVQIKITLPDTDKKDLRNLIVSAYSASDGFYSRVLAGSIDGGGTLIPLKLDNGDKPSCLTAEVEVPLEQLGKTLVMEFYSITVSDDGNNSITKGDLLFGRYAAFTTDKPTPLTIDKLTVEKAKEFPEEGEAVFLQSLPDSEALQLNCAIAEGDYTWNQIEWISSDENVAKIVPSLDNQNVGQISICGTGEVTFSVRAVNGDVEEYQGNQYILKDVAKLTVQEGSNPYLSVSKREDTIMSGNKIVFNWISNIVQKNMEYGNQCVTDFTIQVWDEYGNPVKISYDKEKAEVYAKEEGEERITVTFDPKEKEANSNWPNQQLVFYGFDEVSVDNKPSYKISISADTVKEVPYPQHEFQAESQIYVKSPAVKVNLEPLDHYFRLDDGSSFRVNYSLKYFDADNGAQLVLKVTDNATGDDMVLSNEEVPCEENGWKGSFTFTPNAGKFRNVYDVTVSAKNARESEWTRQSYTVYFYNKDCLDIVVKGVSTDGKDRVVVSEDGSSVQMSNREWIKSLTQDQILNLKRDINLKTVISINYDAHAWGEASDRIRWASENSDAASINYDFISTYTDIEELDYASYAPKTEFILSGKDDSLSTQISASHELLGEELSDSVNVTVETLKDRLYLFQFNPGTANTTLTYVNGKGETVEKKTDAKGRAAIYEESGIHSDVYVKAVVGGTVYLGTVYQDTLKTQEADAVSSEPYPLNSLKLRAAASMPLKIKDENGKPYEGEVTIRGGVYRNGEYISKVKLDQKYDGNQDYKVNFTKEGYTFKFDLRQFETEKQPKEVTAEDCIEFVLEIRVEGYRPLLVTYNGSINEEDTIRLGEHIINLEKESDDQKGESYVAKQVAYFSKNTNGYGTNIRNNKGKLGPSSDYPVITMDTMVFCRGKLAEKPGSISFEDEAGVALIEQTSETEIYSFCSMPVLHNRVIIDKKQLETLNIGHLQTRGIVLNYKDSNGQIVKKQEMAFRLINALNLEKATESKEVSDQVSNMYRMIQGTESTGIEGGDDFLQSGIKFATATGLKLPVLSMTLTPTENPTVYRGLIELGLNNMENDNVTGIDADSDRISDLDANPGYSDLQKMFRMGKDGYLADQKSRIENAKKLLKNNVKSRRGKSKVGDQKIYYEILGYLETEVYYDYDAGKWKTIVVGGGLNGGGGAGYEWDWNFQVGPVPMFIEIGVGAAGSLNFAAAIDHTTDTNTYLTRVRANAYIQAFGGFGFDYSIIAAKIGLYGQLSLDVQLKWLNEVGQETKFAHKVDLSGEVGVKVALTFMFINYERVLWSTGFDKDLSKGEDWDYIQEYWEKVGEGKNTYSNMGDIIDPEVNAGKVEEETVNANLVYANEEDDIKVYSTDTIATVESRDYLEDEQVWEGEVSAVSINNDGKSSREDAGIIWENAYPGAQPRVSRDGAYLALLTDKGSQQITDNRAAYSERNAEGGYEEPQVIDDNGYGDSQLKMAGSKEYAAFVYTRLVSEPPKLEAGETITASTQAAMMNKTEVMCSIRNADGSITTTQLSDNTTPDMAPVVATNGKVTFVAWRQVESSDPNKLTQFDTKDSIVYSVTDDGGRTWTEPKVLFNGIMNEASVTGLEAEMLENGEAAVIFAADTNITETDANGQEIFYAVVDTAKVLVNNSNMAAEMQGEEENPTAETEEVSRYVRVTTDNVLDENPQITTTKIGKEEYFIMGWHCAALEETQDNSSRESNIRLLAVDANGNRKADFVDYLSSLTRNSSTQVSDNFRFTNNSETIEDLSIVWSHQMVDDTEENGDAGHEELEAIRFTLDENNVLGVTAAQTVNVMGVNTLIDNFDVYIAEQEGGITGKEMKAVILGTQYDMETEEKQHVIYDNGEETDVYVPKEISNIYGVTMKYTDTMELETVVPDYLNIKKGMEIPVQFTVSNHGTVPIEKVDITLGGINTAFGEEENFSSIQPGEIRTLTTYYTIPAEKVEDPEYIIDATFANGNKAQVKDTLYLDIADVGIAETQTIIAEEDGQRVLQYTLYNQNDAELKDSGKTVHFGLYKDVECTMPVEEKYLTVVTQNSQQSFFENVMEKVNSVFSNDKEETDDDTGILQVSGKELEQIDQGDYTLRLNFNLKDYIQQEVETQDTEGNTVMQTPYKDENGEVRDGGIVLYAKAWIEDQVGELQEINDTNNTSTIRLESLLKSVDDTEVTISTELTIEDEKTVANVTLKNNSIVKKQNGNIIAVLLDEQGNVIEQQQSYTGKGDDKGFVVLNGEEQKSITFNFHQQGSNVVISYSNNVLEDDNTELDVLKFQGIPITLEDFKEKDTEAGTYYAKVSVEDMEKVAVIAAAKSQNTKLSLGETEEGVSAQLAENIELTPGKINTVTLRVKAENGAERKYILEIENAGPPALQIISDVVRVDYGSEEAPCIEIKAEAQPQGSYKLAYQWYRCDDITGKNPTKLEGETQASFTVKEHLNAGDYYYRCEVLRYMQDGTTKSYFGPVATVIVARVVADITDNTLQKEYIYTKGSEGVQTIDLAALLKLSDAGKTSYAMGEETDHDEILEASVDDKGIFTYQVSKKDTYGTVAKVPITVTMENYEPVTFDITFRLIDKYQPSIKEGSSVKVSGTLTYGETLSKLSFSAAGEESVFTDIFGNTVAGTLTWNDEKQIPTVADTTAVWKFIPDDSLTYHTCTGTTEITVCKAPAAPNVPVEEMVVENSNEQSFGKVKDVKLPQGWSWLEEDKEKMLEFNKPLEAMAVYTGKDAGNYEIEQVLVTITKKDTLHVNTEIRDKKEASCEEDGYTGDTYCKDCDKKLKEGTVLKATGHAYTKKVISDETTRSTATKEEAATYWFTCENCGKISQSQYFADGDKLQELKKPSNTPVLKPEKQTDVSTSWKQNSHKLNQGIFASYKNSKIVLKWGKVKGAKGYDIFVKRCGTSNFKSKDMVKSVKGGKTSVTITKIKGKTISKTGANYKIKVKAYDIADGQKVYIGKSFNLHVTGSKNKKFTNVKKIKLEKTSFVLKKGSSKIIKASLKKEEEKKKLLSKAHGNRLKYWSTNEKVAQVNSKGKVKAVGKGRCSIYVMALNGKKAKVTVIVK